MRRFLLLSLLSISIASGLSVPLMQEHSNLSIPLLQEHSNLSIPLLQEGLGEVTPTRYSACIETPRAAISGICVLAEAGDTIRGTLVNEFGITAIEFTWLRQNDKVRLHALLPALDRWYIRRTLRRDLRHLLHALREGRATYRNERRRITYTLEELNY